jgi:hypothetical protein
MAVGSDPSESYSVAYSTFYIGYFHLPYKWETQVDLIPEPYYLWSLSTPQVRADPEQRGDTVGADDSECVFWSTLRLCQPSGWPLTVSMELQGHHGNCSKVLGLCEVLSGHAAFFCEVGKMRICMWSSWLSCPFSEEQGQLLHMFSFITNNMFTFQVNVMPN